MRFFKLIILCIVLSVTCGFTGSVAAMDAPVSLDDVLRHTYAHNPTLQAARAELEAVKERLPQAQGGFKPTVASTVTVLRSDLKNAAFADADGTTSKTADIAFTQPLYRGGRTIAAVAAARDVIAAQNSFLKSREQDVLLQAVTAYMDVLRDQKILMTTQNNRDIVARQVEATDLRFDVGELTRTDTAQAKARLSAAVAGVTSALGRLNGSMAVFQEVVGLPFQSLVFPAVLPSVPETPDRAGDLASMQNPFVLAAISAQSAASNDADNIFGELLPQVGVFGSYTYDREPQPGLVDDQATTAIGVQATIPLYTAGVTRSRVRAAEHTANQRMIEVREVKREARQRAVGRWAAWNAASAEIKAREAQVSANEVAREGVNQENLYGTRTVLDALDADQELLNAQVALITARREEVVARYSLLSAVGGLSPEGLGFVSERAVDSSLNATAPVADSRPSLKNLDPSVEIFNLGVDEQGQ